MSFSSDEKIVFSQGKLFDSISSSKSDFSHSEPLLSVVLDCLYFVAGEKVNGEILLSIPNDYPPGVLKISSKGIEEGKVINKSLNQSKSIYNIDKVVKSWERKTPEGQYKFPFTFKLPSYAPSTFNFTAIDSKKNTIAGKVFYEVSCMMEFQNSTEKNMFSSLAINVRNKDTRCFPFTHWETLEPVTSLCCVSEGSSLFKVYWKREDHPQVNSYFSYKILVNNADCNIILSNIIGQVRMEFELLINSKKFFFTQVFSCKNIDTWISSHTSESDKEFEFDCQLNFDESSNPSCNNSTIVKCAYFVELFIRYHKKFIRPVHLKIPFHVNPKLHFRNNNPRVLENWVSLESPTNTFMQESFSFMFNSDVSLI